MEFLKCGKTSIGFQIRGKNLKLEINTSIIKCPQSVILHEVHFSPSVLSYENYMSFMRAKQTFTFKETCTLKFVKSI